MNERGEYIGLTRDDLTPDEAVNPMDCPDVADMVRDWVHQLLSKHTDARLPSGKIVVFYEEIFTADGYCPRISDGYIGKLCESRAHLAADYFKSLNESEQD